MNIATECPAVMARFAHGRNGAMNIRAERFPRPPDKRETAAPASTGNGGNIFKTSPNYYNAPAARTQPTPCIKCAWYDGENVSVLLRQRATLGRVCDARIKPLHGRKWSGCNLSATRNPGHRCRWFDPVRVLGGSA